jgi:hypothetical protein
MSTAAEGMLTQRRGRGKGRKSRPEPLGIVMKRRRVQITVETDEVILLRRPDRMITAGCSKCGRPVTMVGLDEAMLIAEAGSREIYRQVESGQLHFLETPGGHLLICTHSLQGIARWQGNGDSQLARV